MRLQYRAARPCPYRPDGNKKEKTMVLNPLHWSYQVWQWFFVISGCWNLFGAVGGILKPALNLEQYYNVKTPDLITIFSNRLFWINVPIPQDGRRP
jgi:hypothetical protein